MLWFGRLPKADELKGLRQRMADARKMDSDINVLLQSAPKHALPMDVLRTAVSALSFYDPEYDRNDHDANVNKAIRLTSQIAMIVANYRSHPKREAGGRTQPVAIARGEFPADAE